MNVSPDIHVCSDAASRRRGLLLSATRPLVLLSASLLSLTSLAIAPAAAQVAVPSPQATAVSPDIIKQREQELEAAREQQRKAAELQQKLKADIAAIGQDRSKLNQQLIDIAGGVRTVETRISDAEARLRPLDTREQQIRASLDSRRSEIVEVLAALQRAG
jgi:murein hydrolase activator